MEVLLPFMPDIAPYWFENRCSQGRFVNNDASAEKCDAAAGMAQIGG